MKTLLSLAFAVLIFMGGSPVFANLEIFDETVTGGQIDAPKLIALGSSGKHHLGGEIQINDISKDWDEGSSAILKYTYSGTVFTLFGK